MTTATIGRACLVAILAAPALAALGPPPGKDRAPAFVLAWGRKGDKPGEFYSPIGIAISGKDEVFVTDLNNARLQRFTAEGKSTGGFDLPRDDPKRKSSLAGGIALDGKGFIYLTFMNQHKVRVYTAEGRLVREWGRRGKGDGELNQPGGIVLAADGTVYVADQGNHRVQQFTREGKFLGKWGGHGTAPGRFGGHLSSGSRFGGPHFLAQDRQGRFYTTEGPGRVQQLTADGKPLAAWGKKGAGPGTIGDHKMPGLKHTLGPIGVLVDRHDRVWVSALNDRVQAFTPGGKYLFGLGGAGSQPGRFARPHGMAFDSKGYFYVCDAGNQRVQKFKVPAP